MHFIKLHSVIGSTDVVESFFPGDVDSADNEEETDSELQARTLNGYSVGGAGELHGHCYSYENGESIDLPNPEVNMASTPISPLACYMSNSYGILRPNQLLRAKVKHETKL